MQVFIVSDHHGNIVGVFANYNEAILYLGHGRIVRGPFTVMDGYKPFGYNPQGYSPPPPSAPPFD